MKENVITMIGDFSAYIYYISAENGFIFVGLVLE
jgi:hypothetical protein